MDINNRLTGVLVSGAVLFALSACDTGTLPPTATSPKGGTAPAPSISSASSASPTPTDDRGRAIATVAAYWVAIDSAAADPSAGLDDLSAVARGQALAQWQTTLADYRAKGWRQTGRSVLSDGRAVAEPSNGFTVTVCRDVTDVDVLDQSGNSVVKAERPNRQRFDYQVVRDDGAFVVTVDRLEGKPCDG